MARDSEVDRLIQELRDEAPDKHAEIDRYVATDGFKKLAADRKIQALTILKSALLDAQAKSGPGSSDA